MNNSEKIPRVIHYCWFGHGKKNELIQRCVESWQKYCPDFQIIEWNENNSDISASRYVDEANSKSMWAFVSDYIRLKALYEYGGIYLDTDVEIVRPIDSLLKYNAVVGYAEETFIGTAFIAASKENPWIKQLIDYYDSIPFLNSDGTPNKKPNNEIITEISMRNCGFKIGDQTIEMGNVKIFSTDYFAPYKKWIMGSKDKQNQLKNFVITRDTYCVHYTDLSWQTNKEFTITQQIPRQILRLILPRKTYWKIKKKSECKRLGYANNAY